MLDAIVGAVIGALLGGVIAETWTHRRARLLSAAAVRAAVVSMATRASSHKHALALVSGTKHRAPPPRLLYAPLLFNTQLASTLPGVLAEKLALVEEIAESMDDFRLMHLEARARWTAAVRSGSADAETEDAQMQLFLDAYFKMEPRLNRESAQLILALDAFVADVRGFVRTDI